MSLGQATEFGNAGREPAKLVCAMRPIYYRVQTARIARCHNRLLGLAKCGWQSGATIFGIPFGSTFQFVDAYNLRALANHVVSLFGSPERAFFCHM